nr:hypothetical protein CFP56_05173 [Quercus suber]
MLMNFHFSLEGNALKTTEWTYQLAHDLQEKNEDLSALENAAGHQAELFDSKVVTNLLDIILTKLAIMDCGYDLLLITHTVEQHHDEVRFSRFEDMKVNVHKDGIKNIESFVKLFADKNSLIQVRAIKLDTPAEPRYKFNIIAIHDSPQENP